MKNKLIVILLSLISYSNLFCQLTYYIDPEFGDDKNCGLSIEEPWASFNNLQKIKNSQHKQLHFHLRKGQKLEGPLILGGKLGGSAELPTIIDSYAKIASDTAKPIIYSSNVAKCILLDNISHVIIRDLHLIDGGIWVLIWGTSNLKLINLTIENTWQMGIQFASKGKVSSENNLIDSCLIRYTGRFVVKENFLNYVKFEKKDEKNPFRYPNGTGSAIHFHKNNSNGKGNIIQNCEISNTPIINENLFYADYLEYLSKNKGNELPRHTEHGVYDQANNTVYKNNYFHDIPSTAIKLKNSNSSGGCETLITYNTFERCYQCAIRFEFGAGNEVSHNLFKSCGMNLYQSNRGAINYLSHGEINKNLNVIKNNVFQDCEIIFLFGDTSSEGSTVGLMLANNSYKWKIEFAEKFLNNKRLKFEKEEILLIDKNSIYEKY